MKYSEATAKLNDQSYAALQLAPFGRIATREQYDYILYYAEHTEIDDRYLKSFEDACGKHIGIGNWFGGAAVYFSLSEGLFGEEEFSYGICGRIEFD